MLKILGATPEKKEHIQGYNCLIQMVESFVFEGNVIIIFDLLGPNLYQFMQPKLNKTLKKKSFPEYQRKSVVR